MRANINFLKNALSILGIALALLPALAEAAAGRFQFVSGNVQIVSTTGMERVAVKGDEVLQGDTIRTTPTSSAQIRMADDGYIVVRPNTELKVTTFVYTGKADGSERSLISLFKGGFRAVTGVIGRLNKDNYKIRTPGATLGIRGTDHEPTFIPDPLPGQASAIEPGTYDKVNSGAVVLSNEKGAVVILPNQAGFVPNLPNVAPRVLPEVPAFFSAPDNNEPVVPAPAGELAPVVNQPPIAELPSAVNLPNMGNLPTGVNLPPVMSLPSPPRATDVPPAVNVPPVVTDPPVVAPPVVNMPPTNQQPDTYPIFLGPLG